MERYPSDNSSTAIYDRTLTAVVEDAYTDRQKADELLAEFDKLPADEKRRAIAQLHGHNPDRTVVVRRPDGKLAFEEVSPEARARILGMGAAGFESVAFNNRKNRRRQKSLTRHASKQRSP